MSPVLSFLADSLGIAMPILLVAMGGLYTEAAGSLNIALEGLMLTGAFAFAASAGAAGNVLWGAIVSVAAACALSLLVALLADRFSVDVFVAGLAVNLLAQGVIGLVSEHVFGTKGVVPLSRLLSSRLDLGFLARVPILGTVLFRQRGVTYLLIAAAVVLAVAFSRTPFGLRVRAAGMSEGALRISGVNPASVRYGAFAASGAACALAGMALTRSVGAWVPNVAAGRGWVALVVIFLGGKRPWGIAAASLGFGALFALSNSAQSFFSAPSELVLALPYAVTAVIVLMGGAKLGGKKGGMNASHALGRSRRRSLKRISGRSD